MSLLKLVNGLPVTISAYDESIYYVSGLAANTTITLPNSGSFNDSNAKDILVIVNDRCVETSRDFTIIGAGPTYTQIQFSYALANHSVVRFKMVV